MADTIREQIIKAFTARAQSLSSDTVERTKRAHVNDAFVRNVSIWDGEDTAEEQAFGMQKCSFPIALDMQFNVISHASTEANAVIGEVIKTIMANDSSFGGLANRMDYVSATPTYPAEGSGIISLVVIFTIFYATQHGDPFVAVN